MLTGEEVTYIDAIDLLALVRGENNESVAVIDVRTDDFRGGKCQKYTYLDPSEAHVPASHWECTIFVILNIVYIYTGHITVASNVPVDEWEDDETIERILKAHISEKKAVVVFHCMYSQMRGPFCAKR
jgi:rhodanese-related sulfurtransferase